MQEGMAFLPYPLICFRTLTSFSIRLRGYGRMPYPPKEY